jgi:hypothetical protein
MRAKDVDEVHVKPLLVKVKRSSAQIIDVFFAVVVASADDDDEEYDNDDDDSCCGEDDDDNCGAVASNNDDDDDDDDVDDSAMVWIFSDKEPMDTEDDFLDKLLVAPFLLLLALRLMFGMMEEVVDAVTVLLDETFFFLTAVPLVWGDCIL